MAVGHVVAFLWRKPTDAGSFSGGSWSATLPLINVVDQDVKKVARAVDTDPANTQFRIDGGTTPKPSYSAFVMLNHDAPTDGKYRIVLSDHSDASAPKFDSDFTKVWVPTVVWGSLPWGAFPWSGIDSSDYPSGTVAFMLLPNSVFARYAFVYLQGFRQVGRFFGGQLWTPSRNFAYGMSLEVHDPSPSVRTRGGRKLTRTLPKYRIVKIKLGFLTEAEALGVVYEINNQLGVSGDFFLLLKPNADPSVLFRFAMYCSLQQTAEIVLDKNGPHPYTVTLIAEELT